MFLDIGLANLYVLALGHFFNVDIEPFHVFVSIAFFLLPDIDAPFELLFYKTLGGKIQKIHRELTHYPIIYPPIIAFVYFYFGTFWGTLMLINVSTHFLHDSLGYGWGIRWLWPFKKDSYKIFGDKIGQVPFVFKKFVESWT